LGVPPLKIDVDRAFSALQDISFVHRELSDDSAVRPARFRVRFARWL